MPIRKIVIASGNEHKIVEFQSMFKPLGIKIVPYKDVVKTDFVMPEETGTTFEENAIIKAEAIAKESGLPVFADDSGFCVKSLNDFPGLRSARFAEEVGGYPQAFDEIEKRLGGKCADAQFVCVIAFVNVSKKSEKIGDTKIFRGECNGFITFPARGENGFGYDPIFVPNSYGVTFAEMSEDEKNAISHRAVASALFVKYIEDLKLEEEANKGKRAIDTALLSEKDNTKAVDVEISSAIEEDVSDKKKEEEIVFDKESITNDVESIDNFEKDSVPVVKDFQKKAENEKSEKTGMAAFLDVDEKFDAPDVPFSSDTYDERKD